MADIVMPRLSDSMEEGTIVKWLVSEGTSVTRGDEIAEIETDKATMTYEADSDGVSQSDSLGSTDSLGSSDSLGAADSVGASVVAGDSDVDSVGATDSLGSTDGLVRSGADELAAGLVVDRGAVDDAAGLLQAAIAPMRARASRIFLNMGLLLGCASAGGFRRRTGNAGG